MWCDNLCCPVERGGSEEHGFDTHEDSLPRGYPCHCSRHIVTNVRIRDNGCWQGLCEDLRVRVDSPIVDSARGRTPSKA